MHLPLYAHLYSHPVSLRLNWFNNWSKKADQTIN